MHFEEPGLALSPPASHHLYKRAPSGSGSPRDYSSDAGDFLVIGGSRKPASHEDTGVFFDRKGSAS